jgi:hypothetical protein
MQTTLTGLSSENFKKGDTHILKYTNDKSRFAFIEKQYEWLVHAKKHLPEYSFNCLRYIKDDNTTGYLMEYIEPEELSVSDVPRIIEGVNKLKEIPIGIGPRYINYHGYVKYVIDIVIKNIDLFAFIDVDLLENELLRYDTPSYHWSSYCHGDLTIDNIIKHKDRIVFIDSNYRDDLWQSYLLDYAKLYQETIFKKPELFHSFEQEILKSFSIDNKDNMKSFLYLLLLTHFIRMIPYAKNKISPPMFNHLLNTDVMKVYNMVMEK